MARDLYNRAPASMEEENEFRSFAAVQNSFINRVFGWMSVGLAVTGVTAWYVANHFAQQIATMGAMWIVLLLLEFGVVIALTAAINKLSAAQADSAAKDQTIEAQNTELNSLKEANAALEKEKKLAELNSALAEFSPEEQALAQAEIDAFKADPNSVELNSITSKICVEMVRKNKEARTNEQNSAPDIFGGVNTPEDKGDVDIFG